MTNAIDDLSNASDWDDGSLIERRNNIYNAIAGKVYDDECCSLVKRAYSFWNQKLAIVINRTVRRLTCFAKNCKISRREFEIRYALFQLSVQKLNEILVCALRRILHKDDRADRRADCTTFSKGYGCFNDDYCENSTASAIVIALSNLQTLAHISLNLDLDRSTQECSIRLTLERTREALCISTSLEGCNRCKDYGHDLPAGCCKINCGCKRKCGKSKGCCGKKKFY